MITPVKRFLQNFFGLSRTETNGFLIFLPLLLLIIFSEPMYAWWLRDEAKESAADKIVLDSLAAQWNAKKSMDIREKPTVENTMENRLFAFDPNHVTEEELKLLGFSPRIASRVVHYREKNGRFRIKSDLMKIYGMDAELFQKLYTYVQLPVEPETTPLHNAAGQNKFVKGETREPVKFDLNQADTAQLKSIYGIGVKLSERIVRYRQKLGGFATLDQLNEVYGLDSAVINRLKMRSYIEKDFQPARININQVTEKELVSHPYFTRVVANAIVTYRFQHGNFKEVNDLRVLNVIGDETIKKISPYLKFDN